MVRYRHWFHVTPRDAGQTEKKTLWNLWFTIIVIRVTGTEARLETLEDAWSTTVTDSMSQ